MIKADGTYCSIHSDDHHVINASRPLSYYEKELDDDHFYRCHKSYLVNLCLIKEIQHHDGTHVLLCNDMIAPVSIRRKKELISRMKELTYFDPLKLA